MEKINYYESLLADENLLMCVIKDELSEIKKKYADARRTKIIQADSDFEDEDLIEEENVAITLTHLGYLKRVPADTYKPQKRGGKGITGLTTRENDFVKDLIMTSTHDYLLFFTNWGKVYKIKAYEIPEAGRTAKGTPAVNFLNLMPGENISAVIPVHEFSGEKYLMAVTKFGTVKKTSLSAFSTNRANGLMAIKLKEGDTLISVQETCGDNNVLIVTKYGKGIRFSEQDVRPMGRIAAGVRGINLEKDDEVVSMVLTKENQRLLVATKKGFGKRTDVSEYKLQARGGKGLLTYDKSKFKKTGALIGAMIVDDDDEIMMVNSDGVIIRIRANDVSVSGRATQGVKIMKITGENEIVAMAKVIREDDESDSDSDATTEEQLTL